MSIIHSTVKQRTIDSYTISRIYYSDSNIPNEITKCIKDMAGYAGIRTITPIEYIFNNVVNDFLNKHKDVNYKHVCLNLFILYSNATGSYFGYRLDIDLCDENEYPIFTKSITIPKEDIISNRITYYIQDIEGFSDKVAKSGFIRKAASIIRTHCNIHPNDAYKLADKLLSQLNALDNILVKEDDGDYILHLEIINRDDETVCFKVNLYNVATNTYTMNKVYSHSKKEYEKWIPSANVDLKVLSNILFERSNVYMYTHTRGNSIINEYSDIFKTLLMHYGFVVSGSNVKYTSEKLSTELLDYRIEDTEIFDNIKIDLNPILKENMEKIGIKVEFLSSCSISLELNDVQWRYFPNENGGSILNRNIAMAFGYNKF